ncbi:MAG: Polyprenol monophosphomannose synthase [Planctomycetes bacterium]|nr:Polyprenol monophosphomannose synthase [Planctomycetota bacterium]
MPGLRLSVVVPMKDEEGSLPVLEREMAELRSGLPAGDELEVLLVDDGSTDGTAAAAESLCARSPAFRLLRHDRNRGFGAGLRTGVEASTGDVVVSYDADCAYPAGDVLKLLAALGRGVDVASATPFAAADGAGEFRVGPHRRLLSWGCSAIYRTALRGRAGGVRTFTCAFRAYRGELIRGTAWRADGFLAAAEILSVLLLSGARVVEVPSTLRKRFAGRSKMKVVRTALGHLRQAARLCVTPAAARRGATAGLA